MVEVGESAPGRRNNDIEKDSEEKESRRGNRWQEVLCPLRLRVNDLLKITQLIIE